MADTADAVGQEIDGIRARLRERERELDEAHRLLAAERERYEAVDRRASERATDVEHERTRLAAVLDQIPLAVAIADTAGSLVVANPVATSILGAEAVGRPMADRSSSMEAFRRDGTRYEPHEWPLFRALTRRQTIVGERMELVRQDGVRVAVDVNAAPVVDERGQLIGAVLAFQDVTEAERRDRAMRDFVVNAAHELRTPVAAISATLDVLESGAKDTPAERDHFLGHLRRATDRLTGLTHALLLLARVESGHEDAPVDVVPLRPLLDELAAEARPASGVELTVRCDGEVVALASARLLAQALSAVLDNALRYTDGGSVTLAAERFGERQVTVSVSDTGAGMDAATLAATTARFFRGSDRGGYGVGLSIARRAVDAMRGTFAIESEPGKGTTVRIALPAGTLLKA